MRFELKVARKGKDDKTYWSKIGSAFPRDDGSFAIVFDALPIPDDRGQVRAMLFPTNPREDQYSGQRGGDWQAPPSDDMGDEIPF